MQVCDHTIGYDLRFSPVRQEPSARHSGVLGVMLARQHCSPWSHPRQRLHGRAADQIACGHNRKQVGADGEDGAEDPLIVHGQGVWRLLVVERARVVVARSRVFQRIASSGRQAKVIAGQK